MPREDTKPEAILEAVKKIDIVSELLDEKNKNNLKMIVEGKVSGGKQIGPYARLLTYSPGEVIMNQGEWGGNTFYFSLDNELEVYVADETGKKRKVSTLSPGTCFGAKMSYQGSLLVAEHAHGQEKKERASELSSRCASRDIDTTHPAW